VHDVERGVEATYGLEKYANVLRVVYEERHFDALVAEPLARVAFAGRATAAVGGSV
jgi:hypothetical protein